MKVKNKSKITIWFPDYPEFKPGEERVCTAEEAKIFLTNKKFIKVTTKPKAGPELKQ